MFVRGCQDPALSPSLENTVVTTVPTRILFTEAATSAGDNLGDCILGSVKTHSAPIKSLVTCIITRHVCATVDRGEDVQKLGHERVSQDIYSKLAF